MTRTFTATVLATLAALVPAATLPGAIPGPDPVTTGSATEAPACTGQWRPPEHVRRPPRRNHTPCPGISAR